jgi:hypothetical protein
VTECLTSTTLKVKVLLWLMALEGSVRSFLGRKSWLQEYVMWWVGDVFNLREHEAETEEQKWTREKMQPGNRPQ